MLSVVSAFWIHPPMPYVIVPWTIAAIACSIRGWKPLGIFFGASAVPLVALMLVINQLPDLGGDWPRDEGFLWFAMVVYTVLALVVCSVLAAITDWSRQRRLSASEEVE